MKEIKQISLFLLFMLLFFFNNIKAELEIEGIIPNIKPVKQKLTCKGNFIFKKFNIKLKQYTPIPIPKTFGKRILKLFLKSFFKLLTALISVSYIPKIKAKVPPLIPGTTSKIPMHIPYNIFSKKFICFFKF